MLKFTVHFSQGIVDPRANESRVGHRSRVMIDMGGGTVASIYDVRRGDGTIEGDVVILNYNVFSVETTNKVIASGSHTLPSFDSIASPEATITFPNRGIMPWASAPLGSGRTLLIMGDFSGQGAMLLIVDTSGKEPSFGPPIPVIDAGDIQHFGDIAKGWAGFNGFGTPTDPDSTFNFNSCAIVPRSFSAFDIVIPSNSPGQVALRSYTVSPQGSITPDTPWRYAWDGGNLTGKDDWLSGSGVSIPLPSRQVLFVGSTPEGDDTWLGIADVARGTFVTKDVPSLRPYFCGGALTLTTRGDVELVALGPDGWPVVVTISIPGTSVKIKSFESLGITSQALESLGALSLSTWSSRSLTEPGTTATRPLPGPLWTVASVWWAPGTSPEGPNPVGPSGFEQAAGMVNYGGPAISTGHRTGTPGDDSEWINIMTGFGNFLVTDTHVLNWRHYSPGDLVVTCWRYRGASNLKPGAASRKGYFS